jgi:threonine/homoserine/homoserine lactone efflux protein
MLKYLIIGGGLGFTAAIQPGPLQAFLISRVSAYGWRRTLPASLAPVLSDGPIALVALLFLSQLPPITFSILQVAGGVLLMYLGVSALRQWRRAEDMAQVDSEPRTLLAAVLVNLLNPNPYLGWALVLGPAALAAWGERPVYAVGLIVTFYGLMVLMMALFIVLVGTVRFLGSQAQRVLLGISAILLTGLGLYLLLTAVLELVGS